ncbi:unnamed protein product [Gadus morhua 'NCC']
MSSSLAAVAAGLELHGLKNRPLKREANSEICQIPTKKRKICSHHPEVVEEKLDSSHMSSNMEIDVYPEGLHKALERLEIEDHGSVSPAFGNLYNLRVAMKHIPKKDLNVSPPLNFKLYMRRRSTWGKEAVVASGPVSANKTIYG